MGEITYAMILLVLGALLGVGGILFARNKSTRKTLGWVGAVAFVLGIIPVIGLSPLGPLSNTFVVGDGGVAPPGQPLVVSGDGACSPGQRVEDTTVTLSGINAFSTTAVGGNHRYRIDGGPATTVADAGTFTASPGNVLDILWFNASTTGAYYSAVDKVVVPCDGTKTFSKELYQNGSLTLRVFNEEGNLIESTVTDGSAGAENETLANGDLVTLNAELIGTFQRGHPYGGVIVAEYDQSVYDDVKIELSGSNVATPTVYAITNAGNTTKTYSFPALLGSTESTGGKILGSVVIDADDTNNPGIMDEIQFTVYTNNYFINEDTGGSFDGPAVEDEDDARTYTHTSLSYLNVD